MKISIETESYNDALRRYDREVECSQIDRNYRYLAWRDAVNWPLTTPFYEETWEFFLTRVADHKLNRMIDKGPRQHRNFVLGRVSFPLPPIKP